MKQAFFHRFSLNSRQSKNPRNFLDSIFYSPNITILRREILKFPIKMKGVLPKLKDFSPKHKVLGNQRN